MKNIFQYFLLFFLLIFKSNAQFTFQNNEAITTNEILAPVLRLDNELRIPNSFLANDPSIGLLDNTGYGINIHKTEGIGFAFNNLHPFIVKPNGSIIVSGTNSSIKIIGTGTGNYQGANLILSADGVNSGNSHFSTWFMTHRGTDGNASIEIQRRGELNEYNGSLLTYRDGYGWRFNVAPSTTSGLSNAIRIDENGNLGIGTTNPDSKLTVAGNIHSREVKVTVNAGADFVFEDNYNLPSLEEVQQFIQENGHLPEIASAKDMEENGIHLSEMNIKLLQKIEELTLYAIEQEKEIQKLKKQNERIDQLEEKLNQILTK